MRGTKKQDKQGVRTPADIERKYDLGQDFSQIEKLAANAQRSAEMAYKVAAEAYAAASKVTTDIESILARLDALENGSLPSGYTLLKYIESSGTQYIDTGFKANQDTRVVFSGYNLSANSSWIYGVWHANENTQFAASVKNTYSIRYGSGSAQLGDVPVGAFEIDQNKNAYNFNGTTGTIAAQTFACSYPMYLFAINAAGAVSGGRFTGRIYSCKIYDNGVLVRDFVPCINPSGAYGLYDRVSKTFYPNAGTGAFTGA